MGQAISVKPKIGAIDRVQCFNVLVLRRLGANKQIGYEYQI